MTKALPRVQKITTKGRWRNDDAEVFLLYVVSFKTVMIQKDQSPVCRPRFTKKSGFASDESLVACVPWHQGEVRDRRMHQAGCLNQFASDSANAPR